MGLGKFILVITVILIAIYFLSPAIFQSGYSQVQKIFQNWNMTLPNIPIYHPSLNETFINKTNQNMTNSTNLTCTESDTTYKCGELSECKGIFKEKPCCIYTPGAGMFTSSIHTDIEYFYCDESNQKWNNPEKASKYGQIYIYLASTTSSGIDSAELTKFASSFKNYLYEASFGYLDNINFVLEPYANEVNPNIDHSQIGNKIKVAYYLIQGSPSIQTSNFWESYNSNINWIFSAAYMKAQFPLAWTTIVQGDLSSDGCWELGGSHDICKESAHELAHAFFACDDYSGDIMRPLPDLPMTNHYPPKCLELIKSYMPQLVAK